MKRAAVSIILVCERKTHEEREEGKKRTRNENGQETDRVYYRRTNTRESASTTNLSLNVAAKCLTRY